MTHLELGLTDKVVLVTGGAGSIGRVVCEGFAEAGAKLAIADLHKDAAAAHAEALGAVHRGFGADLRQVATFPALLEEVAGALGPVDVLVNVAGLIERKADLFAVTEAEWDAQHDVNLKALFFMSRTVAAQMVAAQRAGVIVNFTSQGWMSGGYDGSVVYNAAKGGVTTLTRGLARAWAPHGIRVNAVAPGLVDTPMLRGPDTTPQKLDALGKSVPLGRLGQPEEMVGATVFLASDQARYVTGATVNVSGGFLMY